MNKKKVLKFKDTKFLEFIEELKRRMKPIKSADLRTFYKEVINVLRAASDELDSKNLPQYKVKLDKIIKLSLESKSLQNEQFHDDLRIAKQFLDTHIESRQGALRKLRHIAHESLRVFGGIVEPIDDLIRLTDEAIDIGRNIGNLSLFGRRSSSLSDDSGRYYESLKASLRPQKKERGAAKTTEKTDGTAAKAKASTKAKTDAKSTTQASSDQAEAKKTEFSSASGAVKVEDVKLASSSGKQQESINRLLDITESTNKEIKAIRGLLARSQVETDDRRDDKDLDDLENEREGRVNSVNGKATVQQKSSKDDSGSILSGIGNFFGGLVQSLKWLGDILKVGVSLVMGLGGTVAALLTSPVVITALGGAVAAKGAYDLSKTWAPEIQKWLKSDSNPLVKYGEMFKDFAGEFTGKGTEYHTKKIRDGKFDDIEAQERAEVSALNSFKKSAALRREAYDAKYKGSDSVYGDISKSYDFLGKERVPTQDQAYDDVRAAEKRVSDYEEYLKAKKEKGNGALGPNARFKLHGKTYSNPLNVEENTRHDAIMNHRKKRKHDEWTVSNREDDSVDTPLPPGMEDQFAPITFRDPLLKSSPQGDVRSMMYAIASAENEKYPIRSDEDFLDPRRYTRTEAGENSSAYGPFQITYGLAQGSVEKGIFDSDADLKDWIQKKYIPHGKKLLHSDYSDKKYGAGGKGDLNSFEDRQMYMKMAEKMMQDHLLNASGDYMKAAGVWRFGDKKRAKNGELLANNLRKYDSRYAERVQGHIDRVSRDQPRVQIAAQPQTNRQFQMASLTQQAEKRNSQPVVVPIPIPQGNQGSVTSSGETTVKSFGAPKSGGTDPSMMLAYRMSISPI